MEGETLSGLLADAGKAAEFVDESLERGCEIGLWRLTANRISEIFGVRLTRKLRGKLAPVI